MACLIEAFYRHSLLTPLTSPWASSHPAGRMRKIKFALLSEQFVARDEQHGFSLRGVNPILARTSSFFRRLLPFAPIAPLPPDGFVLVRWEGACAATSVLCLPLSCSCGGAFWQGDVVDRFSFGKKSGVRYHYKMFICVHSCKDTLSFSYRSLSLSLSIFIICRSVCRIISHTFSGIVWRWGLRGWELGTSQSLAKWNGHYILRFISWCTVSVFGVSRGCKDRAFNTYNGSCQIGLSNAKS